MTKYEAAIKRFEREVEAAGRFACAIADLTVNGVPYTGEMQLRLGAGTKSLAFRKIETRPITAFPKEYLELADE